MNNVSELNKLKIQLFIEAVLNQGRLELIDELIATDFVGQLPGAEPHVTGPAGVRQLVSRHRRTHPGLHFKIEEETSRLPHRMHPPRPGPGPGPGGKYRRMAHSIARNPYVPPSHTLARSADCA